MAGQGKILKGDLKVGERALSCVPMELKDGQLNPEDSQSFQYTDKSRSYPTSVYHSGPEEKEIPSSHCLNILFLLH